MVYSPGDFESNVVNLSGYAVFSTHDFSRGTVQKRRVVNRFIGFLIKKPINRLGVHAVVIRPTTEVVG